MSISKYYPLKKLQLKTAVPKTKFSKPLQNSTFGCTEEGILKCEPVNRCIHDCGYCYTQGWSYRRMHPEDLTVYPNLGQAIQLQLKRMRSKPKEVHFSVGTDAFQDVPGLAKEIYDGFKVFLNFSKFLFIIKIYKGIICT